jgi:hypothetical protein
VEENIETDLRKTECKDVKWRELVQDRAQQQAFLNSVMESQVL